MEVGQTVRDQATGKMVKIESITDRVATVSIWFGDGQTYTVNLSELEPVVAKPAPAINQAAFIPVYKTRKEKEKTEHFTQAFDPAMFGESGTTLYCYCGETSRKIAPALIKNVAMQNAALNYVISLCGHCHKPVRFSNATN